MSATKPGNMDLQKLGRNLESSLENQHVSLGLSGMGSDDDSQQKGSHFYLRKEAIRHHSLWGLVMSNAGK